MNDIYNNGEYARNNPGWHDEDAQWKAEKIFALLNKNHIFPKTVCDIGCGTGGVVLSLSKKMKRTCFLGVDVSKATIEIAKNKESRLIKFSTQKDLIKTYDLVLAIDVIEHVEDYLTFLRAIRETGKYKIFHIPLTLSILGSLRKNYYSNDLHKVGHLHIFTKDFVLASLEGCGYKIIDFAYTAPGIERVSLKFMSQIGKLLRIIFQRVSPDLAPKIFGGFSLMIVAK